jgi:superfamily II RNA helicase
MIDSKTVQEVQKELIAAVQRGQEQVRKGQERVRKGQEQVRKSRDVVTGVVSELAKAGLAAIPAGRTVHVPTPAEAREQAREIASHAMAMQRELAGKAWHAAGPYAERVKSTQREMTEKARHTVPYAERIVAAPRDLADRARRAGVAEQVAAAQRTLADRVMEAARVATPLVAEGRARLSQMVVIVRPDASKSPAAADGAGEPELAEVRELVVNKEADAPAKAEPKARTAKPRTATAKAGAAKTGATKTGAAKTGTTKTGTTKTGTAPATGTSKPRTPKK